MPSILILCPTFDHADTLFASTASVRAQKFQDWELVVIGDGAPDRTGEIISTISQEDERIRYEAHPKSERYGEIYRDRVIRESQAEVVLQLGDDDLWAPDHIEPHARGVGRRGLGQRDPLASGTEWIRRMVADKSLHSIRSLFAGSRCGCECRPEFRCIQARRVFATT